MIPLALIALFVTDPLFERGCDEVASSMRDGVEYVSCADGRVYALAYPAPCASSLGCDLFPRRCATVSRAAR